MKIIHCLPPLVTLIIAASWLTTLRRSTDAVEQENALMRERLASPRRSSFFREGRSDASLKTVRAGARPKRERITPENVDNPSGDWVAKIPFLDSTLQKTVAVHKFYALNALGLPIRHDRGKSSQSQNYDRMLRSFKLCDLSRSFRLPNALPRNAQGSPVTIWQLVPTCQKNFLGADRRESVSFIKSGALQPAPQATHKWFICPST